MLSREELISLVVTQTVACLTCVTNAVVIFSLARQLMRRKRAYQGRGINTTAHIYLLNLAISDILVGMVPIAVEALGDRYPMISITLSVGFMRFSMSASILNLLVLAVDRLQAVSSPFRYLGKVTVRWAVAVCVFTWMLAFGLCSIGYFATVGAWIQPIKYTYLGYVGLFVFASVIYTFVAARTVLAIRRQKVRLQTFNSEAGASPNGIAVLVIKLLATFVICWLPLSVELTLRVFTSIKSAKLRTNLLVALALTNSLLNPLLYFRPMRKLRQVASVCSTRKYSTRSSQVSSELSDTKEAKPKD